MLVGGSKGQEKDFSDLSGGETFRFVEDRSDEVFVVADEIRDYVAGDTFYDSNLYETYDSRRLQSPKGSGDYSYKVCLNLNTGNLHILEKYSREKVVVVEVSFQVNE